MIREPLQGPVGALEGQTGLAGDDENQAPTIAERSVRGPGHVDVGISTIGPRHVKKERRERHDPDDAA